MRRSLLVLAAGCLAIVSAASGRVQAADPQTPAPATSSASAAEPRALVDKYCVTCHNERLKTGGLALDKVDIAHVGEGAEVWEKVVRKVRAGVMPPAGRPRPDRATTDGFRRWLETELDRAAAANPNPGRHAVFHRLNRSEYQNAIRDLLAVDLDVNALLPADPASYGFDNIGDALGVVSSSLLERYLSTAQRISRLAVADRETEANVDSFVLDSGLTQRDRFDSLPFGTRGGTRVQYNFPVDGEYIIGISLARNFNTNINGLQEAHQIEVTVDSERVKLFTVGGKPRRRGRAALDDDAGTDEDAALKVRVPVKAGPRDVGVAFLKRSSVVYEDQKRPILRDNPGKSDQQNQPAISRVDIDGPYAITATAAATPARGRIFVCQPTGGAADAACARTIISKLAHRAYRRPVTDADLQLLLRFYDEGRKAGGAAPFDKGIEEALTRILVSPSFLFRVEQDPPQIAAGTSYRVSDIELASRLSFFLWSSIPDDQLLDLAERGKLKDPAVLDQQVRRMLADPKAVALVNNFTSQWLHLRELASANPDSFLFPDFNENLRTSFARESELFINSILREDRSVLDLLTANHTFVNERLARHYGIPNVYGDHFRRVTLTDEARAGLFGQGSVLTLTSQANRTSPVTRGKWIMENILGTKPPDPPANVPPLTDPPAGKVLTMRDRMVQHRANPVCASCHTMMDPMGLALENFDATGQWRASEGNVPLDVSGALPDGTKFEGVAGLKKALLAHSEEFVGTMTEKLLTYGLGRGLEYYDQPTVRQIAREAAARDNRFSALVFGVVKSHAFQMRRSPERAATTASR